MVFSGHRSHGHYLAKGGDLKAMFAELYGRETGCAKGKGGSQHLVDLSCGFMGAAPILASTISVGVGSAWAAKLDRRNEVSVVYFGDGATEEGTFHEAMNFASVHALPVLFVCENNLYSVHSPLDIRQPAGRTIAAFGAAHGMPSATCDGNDPDLMAVHVDDAVARARRGEGPTLLEFQTYRWAEHCGPGSDIALGYRSQEELDQWMAQDPVTGFAARLINEKLLDEEKVEDLYAMHRLAVDAAVEFAKDSPYPQPAALELDVFPHEAAR